MMTGQTLTNGRVGNVEHVLALGKVSRADSSKVGNKAAVLGELSQSGFEVPDGYVLTVSAFRSFADANDLVNQGAGRSKKQVVIPTDVGAAISEILQKMGDGLLAVRSSGVSEDSPGSSYAGLYETVLGAKGKGELEDAVVKCWISTFDKRVVEYKRTRPADMTNDMAVVIQKLVRADSAGVAFSANPVNGANEVVVNAVRGLGDRLVAGAAAPDEWVVGERATCVKKTENSITEDQAVEVAKLAKEVERYFGAPQDIEWAISGSRLFLLQARPITTSAGGKADEKIVPIPIPIVVPQGYWKSGTEASPRPMSPMYASYALEEINVWLRQLSKDLGLPFEGIQWRLIGGWAYGRIVPPGGKDRKPPPKWLLKLLVRIVPSIRSQVKRMVQVVRTDVIGSYIEKWNNEWKSEILKSSNELLAVNLSGLTDPQLEGHLSAVISHSNRAKEIHFRYLAISMLDIGAFATSIQDHLKWDSLKVFDLLAGVSKKDSEPSRRLSEMAGYVRENPKLAAAVGDAIQTGNYEQAMTDSTFKVKFDYYMRDFGAAALAYEVIDPTMAEMPLELLRLMRGQIGVGYDPSAAEAELGKKRTKAEAEIFDSGNLPDETRTQLKKDLTRARIAYALHNEETFYTQNLTDGITRYSLLEVGRRLAARGVVGKLDDVFMLTLDEAKEALRNGKDQKQLVKKRAAERLWAYANPGPASYGTPPPPAPPIDIFPPEVQKIIRSMTWVLGGVSIGKAPAGAGLLKGTPGSTGSYEGFVRVIKEESELDKLCPGDVLVCTSLTPSWSVMFSTIGALVTEVGGVLSHPAIVAREYGLPAVLSVEGATQKLKDGQRVRIDGDTGIVTPLT